MLKKQIEDIVKSQLQQIEISLNNTVIERLNETEKRLIKQAQESKEKNEKLMLKKLSDMEKVVLQLVKDLKKDNKTLIKNEINKKIKR